MIRAASEKDASRLKEIWRETFLDPDAYINDVIFEYKVTQDTALLLEKDAEAASVVYMPKSHFSFWEEVMPASYVMGVATAKEYRGRGYMKPLMEESLRKMYREGTAFCTLIPAQDWLYDYYASFGFLEAFYLKKVLVDITNYKNAGIEITEGESEEELYRFYFDFYVNEPFYLRKTLNDFKAVIKDHALGDGHVRIAQKDGKISGICFAIGTDGCTIKELCAEDEDTRAALILDAARLYNENYVNIISRPKSRAEDGIYRRGMIRAVRIADVLSSYAAANADVTWDVSVKDDIILENCGVYRLCSGTLKKISDEPHGDAVRPEDVMKYALADKLCYMNLMLD